MPTWRLGERWRAHAPKGPILLVLCPAPLRGAGFPQLVDGKGNPAGQFTALPERGQVRRSNLFVREQARWLVLPKYSRRELIRSEVPAWDLHNPTSVASPPRHRDAAT